MSPPSDSDEPQGRRAASERIVRVAIVDDEPWMRAEMKLLLGRVSDVVLVGEGTSVEDAIELLEEHRPDVLFLDIHLRNRNAFELFDRTAVRCHVVFVTAHDDYAVRAFEVNALDYLVKPIRPEHLERALRRVPARRQPEDGHASFGEQIYLRDGASLRLCAVADITHVQAAEVYTEVHLRGGEIVLIRERMHVWERRLPEAFVRIHRSTLVNVHHIVDLASDNGRWKVRVHGVDEPLSVSRRLAPSVKGRLEARSLGRSD